LDRTRVEKDELKPLSGSTDAGRKKEKLVGQKQRGEPQSRKNGENWAGQCGEMQDT